MAILKSTKAKLAQSATPPPTKEENQLRVAKALENAMGRPAANQKEARTRAATAAVMSGSTSYADAERLYGVAQMEIKAFVERTFPTDEDRFAFLENCMLTNAMLASSRFVQCYGELSAVDAARAASIFAGKAVEIRKARETGFKEAPVNVTTIVALEKTLKSLIQKPVDVAA